MLAPGHIAVGLTCYWGACQLAGYQPAPELYTAAAFGALLPDIDHPQSQVGRMFPSVSRPVAALVGHRGFTHSLLATLLMVAALVVASTRPQFAEALPHAVIGALSLGYLSHLLADYLTVRGIPLFWPYRRPAGDYHIPLVAFRTGGVAEWLITGGLGLLLTYLAVY